MKKAILLFAAAGLAVLTGCHSNYINQPNYPLEVKAVAKVKPEITVEGKIQGTAAVSRTLFFFVHGPGKFAEGIDFGNNDYRNESVSTSIFDNIVEMAKAAAAYRACAQNKADFIICPRYVISVENYFFYQKAQAKVFGYKGVLRDIKLPEKKHHDDTQVQQYMKNISKNLNGINRSTEELAKVQKVKKPSKKETKNLLDKETHSDKDLQLGSKVDFSQK